MARILRFLLALGLAACLGGCSGSTPQARRSTPHFKEPPKPAPTQFLHVDAAHHAVDLTLIAADGSSNNGFNFDGYGRGELLVSVPSGWRVTVHCRNGGPLRNSCAVVPGPESSTLAFRGASTPDPVVGLTSGDKATFSFTPTRIGTYRFASLVPGHELARMWDVLEVTHGGRASISARPGP